MRSAEVMRRSMSYLYVEVPSQYTRATLPASAKFAAVVNGSASGAETMTQNAE